MLTAFGPIGSDISCRINGPIQEELMPASIGSPDWPDRKAAREPYRKKDHRFGKRYSAWF